MGSFSLDQENTIGKMVNDDDDSFSSDVSSVESLDDETKDVFEECDSSSSNHCHALGHMSDPPRQLPSMRSGLSKFFQGKSQSFTSLSKAMCLEDLAKPENPKNKELKLCKSSMGLPRDVDPSPTRRNASSASLSSNSCRLAVCSSSIS